MALIFRTEIFAQAKLSELVDVIKTQQSNAHVMVFNDPSYGLGNFYFMALKLFFNLEHKLKKDVSLYNAYREFMDDYIFLGLV